MDYQINMNNRNIWLYVSMKWVEYNIFKFKKIKLSKRLVWYGHYPGFPLIDAADIE
jgi:hypothetical protein